MKDSHLLVKDSLLLVEDCHLLVKDYHLLVKDSHLLVNDVPPGTCGGLPPPCEGVATSLVSRIPRPPSSSKDYSA